MNHPVDRREFLAIVGLGSAGAVLGTAAVVAGVSLLSLDLVDEAGVVHNDAVRIAGTDAGLLPAPAEVPAAGLTLTPAERVDLLIDFSRFAGQRLRLTSTGSTVEPDIMEFRVESRVRQQTYGLSSQLSPSYTRTQVPADHDEVFVATIPSGVAGRPHPELWELAEITESPSQFPTEGVIQLTDPVTGRCGRSVGSRACSTTPGRFSSIAAGGWCGT